MIALLLASLLGAEGDARNSISLPVTALLASGVGVQAERATEDLQWSFATSLGVRASGGGDYRAFNLSLGLETRRWWHVGPLSNCAFGAVGGVFAWLRADAVWVRLEAARGRAIGSTVRSAFSAGAGYRFLPGWRLELTPLIGAGFDLSTLRATFNFGLTIGVVF